MSIDNLDELRKLNAGLTALLADAHPGLGAWCTCLANNLAAIAEFAPTKFTPVGAGVPVPVSPSHAVDSPRNPGNKQTTTCRLRWNCNSRTQVERRDIDAFLAEVVAVCRKHGFSISHEDGQGAFKVEPFSEDTANWLMSANIQEMP